MLSSKRNSDPSSSLRDISETGAKLQFQVAPPVTETLELHIPIKGQSFKAKVQRRHGAEIGVRFGGDGCTNKIASPAQKEALLQRVSRLEREIEALKKTVARLQNDSAG